MSEKEKEFYVTKIEEYNDEVSELRKIETTKAIMVAFWTIMVLYAILINSNPDPNNKLSLYLQIARYSLIIPSSTVLGILSLREMIIAIVARVGQTNRIREIEDLLEYNDIESPRKSLKR